MDVQISLWDLVYNYLFRGGIVGSCGSFNVNFWGISLQFSIVAVPFYNPTGSTQALQFLTSSPTLIISVVLIMVIPCEELTHWKRLWCWEGLGAGGEGVNRGWDGWMASLTRWTWVWVNSGSWWWTGRPGVLRFMGLQRVGHDWATKLNWIHVVLIYIFLIISGVEHLFMFVYLLLWNVSTSPSPILK